MRNAFTAIAILALLGPLHADEFHLTSPEGKTYGPFAFRQGEVLSIAGQKYTISKVLTQEQKIIEKMKAIMIPEVEFRQAHVRDVIDFLQHSSVDFDETPERRHRGVSAVLNLGSPAVAPPASTTDPFGDDPFSAPLKAQSRPSDAPLITFSARHISLYETINIVCKLCNLQWAIQNSVIMIEPKTQKKVQPES